MRKLLLLLLISPAWAAVSFHAAGTIANQNGGAMTVNLPTVSNNDYVLCFISLGGAITGMTSNGLAFTTPTNYTSWIASGPYALFGHLWKTGDPTSISVSEQNGASSWETGVCVSYSGVDTTTPVDGAANYGIWNLNGPGAGSTNAVTAPAVAPQFNADMLVQGFFDASNFGATFTTPAGFTNRVAGNIGPNIYINDQLLANGNNTGSFNSTASLHNFHGAVQILLKGGTGVTAAVQPTIAGYFPQSTPADFNVSIFPQNGDLIVYALQGGTSGSPAVAGYTTVYNVNDVGLFTHKWLTGDGTNPSVSGCTNCGIITYIVRNYNPTGVTLVSPTVDNSTTCAQASATSITCPGSGMSISGTNDLLMADFSSGTNSGGNTNAWTLSASLTYGFIKVANSLVSVGEGYVQGVSNPTGTYTSTIAGSAARLGSGVVGYVIVSASATNGFTAVY